MRRRDWPGFIVFGLLGLVCGLGIVTLAYPGDRPRPTTVYLPLIRSGYLVTVTGNARWEPDSGPVAYRQLTLLAVVSENPLILRHNTDSPQAGTDAQGRFAFQGVKDGVYVLGIEDRPPFGWAPVMYEGVMYLVEVGGESVEMGVVRVGVTHLWGE